MEHHLLPRHLTWTVETNVPVVEVIADTMYLAMKQSHVRATIEVMDARMMIVMATRVHIKLQMEVCG